MVGSLDPFATATAMLAALRDRRLSAVELLDLHVRRIERHNPTLNAVVVSDFDRARDDAAVADAMRGRGDDRPLLGLPLTIKETINVIGLPNTAGLSARAGMRAEADAPLVSRLRAAGAVIIGKTNVPPAAADYQTDNPIYGRTINPWDHARTPGGSSGGGAAALAVGMSPLDFGTDMGGSLRVPPAFCGVYGHKPSETALPRSGTYDEPDANPTFTMNVQGPMARDAADLELALDVVAGPDEEEGLAWRLHLPPARHERLADFRVAVLPIDGWVPVQAEIRGALDELVGRLRGLGATVGEAVPEEFDVRDDYQLFLTVMGARMQAGMTEEQCRSSAAAFAATGDPRSASLARGLEASAGDYIRWHGERGRRRAAWRAFFRSWDVLLMPAASVVAFPHIPLEVPMAERTLDVDGHALPYTQRGVFGRAASLYGLPTTAFPAGRTRGGLPIGLQAMGPYLEDRTPLRFAALVGREVGGFRAPPGYGVDD